MTETIYTFFRDGKALAELQLSRRLEGSVWDWTWRGDPEVQKLIKPLPRDDQHLYQEWGLAIIQAAERTGLTYEVRYEGEALGFPG